MKNIKHAQQGKSSIILIIILALIGVGVYIALQYVPIKMESGTVDTILDNIEKLYETREPANIADIKKTISTNLNMNQKSELKDNFLVEKEDGEYVITVSFERELNLLYKKQIIKYDRTVFLQ